MDRVRYFTLNDMARGFRLEKVESMYPQLPESFVSNINDVIELHVIHRYIKEDVKLKIWTDERFQQIKEYTKSFESVIAKYFNSIIDTNIAKIIATVEWFYMEDFWYLFNHFKCYKHISPQCMCDVLKQEKSNILNILHNKHTVQNYDSLLRDYLISDCNSAEVILLTEQKNTKQKIFLPTTLTNDDFNLIFDHYISSDSPHLKELEKIIETKLTIKAATKLKAYKRYHEEIDKLFSAKSGLPIQVEVDFIKNLKDIKVCKNSGLSISVKYNLDWVLDNTDFGTLLNNFIYLFGYVDRQMRIQQVSLESEAGIFEKVVNSKTKNSYFISLFFKRKNMLAQAQFNSYYNLLKGNGINLEEIIRWFFVDYLAENFLCKGFNISIPSKETTFAEKCVLICVAMDSVLRQFDLLAENREINCELLPFCTPKKINDIPSLLRKKYAYGIGENYTIATNLIFSDQCMLAYVENSREKYDNFFELVRTGNALASNCPEYCQGELNWLIDNNFITIHEDAKIRFVDINIIKILQELYLKGVISVGNFPNYVSKIEHLESLGYVKFENTLFSKPEADYLNYYLNRAEWTNGLDLRNRYVHGIQQACSNEREHELNYYLLLRLFILIVLKVNDEFCLLYPEAGEDKVFFV